MGHGPHSSILLCCSMYCLCVNVYCTAATGWLHIEIFDGIVGNYVTDCDADVTQHVPTISVLGHW